MRTHPASNCQNCELFRTRTQVVWGTGSSKSGIVILGEAPGFNEDIKGLPFIGRSGDILNAALSAASLSRQDVYITNTVKCRPTVEGEDGKVQNRTPKPREVEACEDWLGYEFSLQNPYVVVVLGKTANRIAFAHEQKVPSNVARSITLYGKPVVVLATYHPSFIARSGGQSSAAFQELVATLKRARLYASKLQEGKEI
jgi:uracil-DNA glycosylase family 4